MALGLTQQVPIDDRHTYDRGLAAREQPRHPLRRPRRRGAGPRPHDHRRRQRHRARDRAGAQDGLRVGHEREARPDDLRQEGRGDLPRPRLHAAGRLLREHGGADRRRGAAHHPRGVRARASCCCAAISRCCTRWRRRSSSASPSTAADIDAIVRQVGRNETSATRPRPRPEPPPPRPVRRCGRARDLLALDRAARGRRPERDPRLLLGRWAAPRSGARRSDRRAHGGRGRRRPRPRRRVDPSRRDARVRRRGAAPRLLPVLAPSARRRPCRSRSTRRKAAVAAAALDAGADIVNDVSAGASIAGCCRCAPSAGVPVVLMHMRDGPATMQRGPALPRRGRRGARRSSCDGRAAARAGRDSRATRSSSIPASASARRWRTTCRCCAAPRPASPRSAIRCWWGCRARGSSARCSAAGGHRAAQLRHGRRGGAGGGRGARLVRVHDVAAMRDVVRVAEAVARA